MTTNGVRFDPETHRYFDADGTPLLGVSAVLQLAGLQPSFNGVPPHLLDIAATLGTRVHEATAIDDAHRLGWSTTRLVLEQCDPQLVPRVAAWRRCVAESNISIMAQGIERILAVCDGVAGTCDRVIAWEGNPGILDVKTGSTLGDSIGLQLAAYALGMLDEARHCLFNPKLPVQAIVRVVVQLKADGSYTVITDRDDTALARKIFSPEDYADFLAAVRVAKRRVGRCGIPAEAGLRFIQELAEKVLAASAPSHG